MDKRLKKYVTGFNTQYSHAIDSGNWNFLKNIDLNMLYDELKSGYLYKWKSKDLSSSKAQHDWEIICPTLRRIEWCKSIRNYIKSRDNFKKLYPDWFAVRNGKKLDEYLFSHLDKFKFRKKFLRPPKLEDTCIKWLLALQMLGCAVWRDIADFANVHRDGMCAELDVRESMVGAGWMEVVGEDKHRGKTRPIYSITDIGANVIQYCAEH